MTKLDYLLLITSAKVNMLCEYALRGRLKGNIRGLKIFSYWLFEKSHTNSVFQNYDKI